MLKPLELSTTARHAFGRMAADFTRVFGERFDALIAYAPERGAAFASAITAADLDALSMLTDVWHRSGLATPLVLTSEEFRRSLDAFPLEYQAILDRHVVIAGTPPFAGSTVPREELRRACETQAKGHLVHLRQSWLDAAGHNDDLAHRVAASALPLRVLLSHVASLRGHAGVDTGQFAADILPAHADVLRAVLALEHNDAGEKAMIPRLPQYLAACEAIWAFVDEWRA
jgi:hypothetical protein